jgi:hypothetical protein
MRRPYNTITKSASVVDASPRASEDIPASVPKPPISPVKAVAEAAAAASTGPDTHRKEMKKASVPKSHGRRSSRQEKRREKSGIPEFDDDLSDTNGDDDWDFIEADGEGGGSGDLACLLWVPSIDTSLQSFTRVQRRAARVLVGRQGYLAHPTVPALPAHQRFAAGAPVLCLFVATPRSVSVGNPGSSCGASTNGDARIGSGVEVIETILLSRVQADENEKLHHKNNRLERGAPSECGAVRPWL